MTNAPASLCLAALLLAVVSLPLAGRPLRVSGQIQGPAGARVELLPQSGAPPVATARTDAEGRFELTVPESGCFRVRAQVEGHLGLEIPVLAVVEDVELAPVFAIPVSAPRSQQAIGNTATDRWVFAAPAPAALPPPPATPRLVQGKVSDAKGAPLPGALVWSEGSPAVPFVRAGAEGAFQIRLPASGEAQLRAVAPGYLPSDPREPAAKGTDTALRLEPEGAIAGQVVDAAGHPLAKVRIGALPVQWTEGRASRYGTTWSRADGRFRLPSLSPGERYELTATLEGFAPASRQAAALPDPVPMRLILERGATAFGRVLDRENRPVQGAELVLSVNEGAFSDQINPTYEEAVAHATSDARGSFELQHLNPGRLRLRVKSRGFAPFALPEVEVPSQTARIDLGTLTLDRGLAIEGRVTDPRGVPLPDVDVSLNTQITLFTTGPDNQDSPAAAQTGPDGRFRFDDLRRGAKFELHLERQGYVPASVRVDVPAPESLAIELKPGRTLSGRVTGPAGEPVRNAVLTLREERHFRLPEGLPKIDGWRHLGTTDEEGKFRAEGVPPGTADLSVFAHGYRSRQPPGIPVPEDRDVEGLEIALEKASALEIRALDGRGKPVEGAWIEARRTDSLATESRGRTDAEGRCRLDGVEPGRYEVSARSEEQGQGRITLDAAAGVTARDLVLARGVEVSGRVSDESGEPVPGANLSLWPAGKGAALTAHAGADGAFRFQSVGDGTFRLSGSAPDFAETFAPAEVQVAGQEVRGLDLRLSRGTTLTGKVLGLEPEELGSVLVVAVRPDQASFQPVQGRVDLQGRYRIEGLGPGDWQVVAHQMKGRSLLEPLQIAPGLREAVLDLRFQTGFTLSGQVLVDRAPFAEAEVVAFTRDRSVQAKTGPDGRFQVSNLPADHYDVRVMDLEHGLSATRSVEIAGDQTVTFELATGSLRGRISSAGGEPVAGAFIQLEDVDPGISYPFRLPGGTSDAAGAFEISRIYAGTYRIVVEKEGFTAYTANVEVRPGIMTPVVIELRPEP